MQQTIPTTDDVGAAIRDALELLDGIEITKVSNLADVPEEGEVPEANAEIDHIDDEDLSNLKLLVRGKVFVVRVIMKD